MPTTLRHSYTVYTHPYGKIYVSPQHHIPLTDFTDICQKASKKAVHAIGIAWHYQQTLFPKQFVACITLPSEIPQWEKEIDEDLKSQSHLSPEMRWLLGTNTGASSLTIFAALANSTDSELTRAKYKEHPNTPHDADDLKRCFNLCDALNWHDRMPEVAAVFPNTKWPKIVSLWQSLRNDSPENQTATLRNL